MRGKGDGLVNKEFAENENSDPRIHLKIRQAQRLLVMTDRH